MVMQVTRGDKMLTNKRERARQQRAALWATRDNVQRHALSMSMPPAGLCQYRFCVNDFLPQFYLYLF